MTRSELRTASPRVTAALMAAVRQLAAPATLRERNLQQLVLAQLLGKRFELTDLKALEMVMPVYRAKFPLPVRPKRRRMPVQLQA